MDDKTLTFPGFAEWQAWVDSNPEWAMIRVVHAGKNPSVTVTFRHDPQKQAS